MRERIPNCLFCGKPMPHIWYYDYYKWFTGYHRYKCKKCKLIGENKQSHHDLFISLHRYYINELKMDEVLFGGFAYYHRSQFIAYISITEIQKIGPKYLTRHNIQKLKLLEE